MTVDYFEQYEEAQVGSNETGRAWYVISTGRKAWKAIDSDQWKKDKMHYGNIIKVVFPKEVEA